MVVAAAPVIIHLLSRRRVKRVPFSSVRFLVALQEHQMRRLRLRQLLLLLLRTLILVFLVLAFARPTLRGYLGLAGGGGLKTSAVIVLDNSLSMQYSAHGGTIFDLATERIGEVFKTLGSGDEASVLLTSPRAHGIREGPTHDIQQLAEAVPSLTPTFARADLPEAIAAGAERLSGATYANKELFVVSDFQRSEGDFIAAGAALPSDAHLFLLPVGLERRNLLVEEVEITSQILREGEAIDITAWLRSSSQKREKEAADVRVDLYLDGERVAQTTARVAAEGRVAVPFEVIPSRAGHFAGFVEIPEDELVADNRRYFHLFIPPEIRVLMVGLPEELTFPRLALESSSKMRLSSSSPAQWGSVILADYDVVVVMAGEQLQRSQWKGLRRFVERGGGLFLIPAPRFDLDRYNAMIAEELALPRINGILTSEGGGYLEVDEVDWNHPIFAGVFIREREAWTPPRFYRMAEFEGAGGGRSLIDVTGGVPAAITHSVGEGRIIMFAAALDLEWTDFPLRGLFVPFVNRSVEYLFRLSGRFGDDKRVGDLISFPVTAPTFAGYSVRTPHGRLFAVGREETGGSSTVPFAETDEPGTYQLLSKAFPMTDSMVVGLQTVNVAPEEGDVRVWESDALSELGPEGAVAVIPQQEELADVVTEARFGIELWRHCLLAALLLLVIEMLLARERWQGQEVTQTVQQKAKKQRVPQMQAAYGKR